MRETYYKLESEKIVRIKRLMMIPGGLALGFLIAGSLSSSHRLLGFSGDWLWLCGASVIIIFGATGFMYYGLSSELILIEGQHGSVELKIRSQKGQELSAKGPWQWSGCFTREYGRYGTYKKNIYFYLYSNGRMFCVIRTQTGGLKDPPGIFVEARNVVAADAPVYFARDFDSIFDKIMRSDPERLQ